MKYRWNAALQCQHRGTLSDRSSKYLFTMQCYAEHSSMTEYSIAVPAQRHAVKQVKQVSVIKQCQRRHAADQ